MKKIFTCIRIMMMLVGMQVSAHSPYAYDLDSDGSVKSYYLYDVAGQKVGTIAENVLSSVFAKVGEAEYLFCLQIRHI